MTPEQIRDRKLLRQQRASVRQAIRRDGIEDGDGVGFMTKREGVVRGSVNIEYQNGAPRFIWAVRGGREHADFVRVAPEFIIKNSLRRIDS